MFGWSRKNVLIAVVPDLGAPTIKKFGPLMISLFMRCKSDHFVLKQTSYSSCSHKYGLYPFDPIKHIGSFVINISMVPAIVY